jgi:hypothetical protein
MIFDQNIEFLGLCEKCRKLVGRGFKDNMICRGQQSETAKNAILKSVREGQ